MKLQRVNLLNTTNLLINIVAGLIVLLFISMFFYINNVNTLEQLMPAINTLNKSMELYIIVVPLFIILSVAVMIFAVARYIILNIKRQKEQSFL